MVRLSSQKSSADIFRATAVEYARCRVFGQPLQAPILRWTTLLCLLAPVTGVSLFLWQTAFSPSTLTFSAQKSVAVQGWILQPVGLSSDDLPTGRHVVQLQCGQSKMKRRVRLTAQAYVAPGNISQTFFLYGSSARDIQEVRSCVEPIMITARLKRFSASLSFGRQTFVPSWNASTAL